MRRNGHVLTPTVPFWTRKPRSRVSEIREQEAPRSFTRPVLTSQGKTRMSMWPSELRRLAARSRGLCSVPASPAAWSFHAYFVLAASPLAFAASGALRWQLEQHN